MMHGLADRETTVSRVARSARPPLSLPAPHAPTVRSSGLVGLSVGAGWVWGGG